MSEGIIAGSSIRWILPTKKIYEQVPIKARLPIKINAGEKLPSETKKPITIGTTTAAKPPIKLKTPPVNPTKCFGARVDTNTHVIEASPLPKKAIAINNIIKDGLLT